MAGSGSSGHMDYAVQAHLRQLAWIMNHACDWHHPGLPGQRIRWGQDMNVGYLKHLLRDSWRRCCFESWQSKNRRDAATCAAIPYDAARVRLAYLQCKSACGHGIGVLMGSVVRLARIQVWRIGGAMPWCPFCCNAQVPDWAHCAWICDAFSSTRPARPPADALQAVLGWPCVQATSLL